MNIKGMNHRIVLKQPSIATNAIGEQVVTYTNFSTRWAKLESRVESERSGSTMSKDQIVLIVRHSADIDSDFRIEYKGADYIITQIEELEYRKFQRLTLNRADSLTHS